MEIWHDGESVTMDNVDFGGQTTDLDEFIDPKRFMNYESYKREIDNLLDTKMTSESSLWRNVRKYIRKNIVDKEQFYA